MAPTALIETPATPIGRSRQINTSTNLAFRGFSPYSVSVIVAKCLWRLDGKGRALGRKLNVIRIDEEVLPCR